MGFRPSDYRQRVERTLTEAIGAEAAILAAILLGSTATGSADAHSDLDYFLYLREPSSAPTDTPWWSLDRMGSWLEGAGLVVDLHYWTGVDKHRLLVDRTRVDISLHPASHRAEVAWWPSLFFPQSAIVKDEGNVLRQAYCSHRPAPAWNALNDLSGYVLNLIAIAAQLCRGETVNARSRFMSVVEARARILRKPSLGTALWREPTRHVERDLQASALQELRDIAFVGSPKALHDWVLTELRNMSRNAQLPQAARDTCVFYAHELCTTVYPRDHSDR